MIARKNREFQERMTKHRYQYQMADMRAAGLNPMLAMGQSPPGSPPGAMAQIPDFGASLSKGVSAWSQKRLQDQQAQTELDKQSLLGMQEAHTSNMAEHEKWKAALAALDFDKMSNNDFGYWSAKAGGPMGGAVGIAGKAAGALGKGASGAAMGAVKGSGSSAQAVRRFLLQMAK